MDVGQIFFTITIYFILIVYYGLLWISGKKLIMKTLKQLKEKYDKLLKECNILYEEIHTL